MVIEISLSNEIIDIITLQNPKHLIFVEIMSIQDNLNLEQYW